MGGPAATAGVLASCTVTLVFPTMPLASSFFTTALPPLATIPIPTTRSGTTAAESSLDLATAGWQATAIGFPSTAPPLLVIVPLDPDATATGHWIRLGRYGMVGHRQGHTGLGR
ncbi:hypothetical protein GUJ93_ZPchr0005g16118 [Zizania palustris]|uniref:Uncharacterized protein n=1 Tax=Zizania palustris TaxID=103762 RepID=A0A8J5VG20_ZIZPA|nr:hypothetical protein GUJ93_ZPchr0005g16118 [Zizania palustris]